MDDSLHPNERQVLYIFAEELGINRSQFDQFLKMMEDACKVLCVSPQDDDLTIKRAYRKLMSEHHPDKLMAKWLLPEMMEMAKQKTQASSRPIIS